LVVVSKSKKPADSALPDLLKPTSDLITQVQQCFEKNRNKKEVANFLSAVSEGVPALGWVMMSPKPAPHVVQMKEAAEFYTNRVLKEATDDTQKSWARTLPNVLNEIANFVKKYHTTGVVWNPKGGEASAASSSSTTSTNTSTTTTSSSSSSSNSTPSTPPKTEGSSAPTPNLFAALNKGSDITSGLKKVDKSQMTHKNPELRAGGVVQAKDEKEKVEKTTGGKVEDKPPKFALEGNKWVVEFQKNNNNLVIDNAENKHTVYIYKCTGSTVTVKGKVNQITIDGCKKTGVVCDNVISGVDLVNSQSVQVQITGKAPTVSIDKTDGAQIYLSKDGLATEVLSSKSSEMNVLIPGAKVDDDMIEIPIPEQFKTIYVDGKFKTELVEHSSA